MLNFELMTKNSLSCRIPIVVGLYSLTYQKPRVGKGKKMFSKVKDAYNQKLDNVISKRNHIFANSLQLLLFLFLLLNTLK